LAVTKREKKVAAEVKNTATKAATTRRRGRPPISENGLLDRNLIIACAFQMSRATPLQDLSIVRVARELGVTPALIHYYLNGRDALTSGVMNAFYREMLREWPALTGNWRVDAETVVRRVYDQHVAYPGIAAYVVAHNRYRLKQILVEGETDYGVQLFENVVATIREAGFDSYRTAMLSHLLIEFVVSMAFAAVRHRFPGEHGEHLDRIFAALDPKEFPSMHFVRKDYVRLNAGEVFSEAFKLMLTGIDLEQSKAAGSSAKKR
jgi:AcrR family transcriptional regulator